MKKETEHILSPFFCLLMQSSINNTKKTSPAVAELVIVEIDGHY
jgi:hypothetical protein